MYETLLTRNNQSPDAFTENRNDPIRKRKHEENVVMWDFCSVKLKNALVCLGVEGRGRAFLDLIETLSHKLGASILPVKGWGQRLPLSRSWWNSMVRVPHRCYGGRGFDFFLELWNLFSGSSDPLSSNHHLLSNYCFIEPSALGISFFFRIFIFRKMWYNKKLIRIKLTSFCLSLVPRTSRFPFSSRLVPGKGRRETMGTSLRKFFVKR